MITRRTARHTRAPRAAASSGEGQDLSNRPHTSKKKQRARIIPRDSDASDVDETKPAPSNKAGHLRASVVKQFKDFGEETRWRAQDLANSAGTSATTVMQVAGLTAMSTRKINIANAFKSYYADTVRQETAEGAEPRKLFSSVFCTSFPMSRFEAKSPPTSVMPPIKPGTLSTEMTKSKFKPSSTTFRTNTMPTLNR